MVQLGYSFFFFTCFGKSYIEKKYYIVRKSHNTVPQPPHVAVLVGEKTVGVVAAVLDIVESAAVDGCSRVPRSGAGESVHERTIGAAVGAAFTHAGGGKKTSPVAAGQRGDEDWHIFASAPLLKKGKKKDGGADSGEVDPSLTPPLSHSLCAEINPSSLVKRSKTADSKSIKTLSQQF